jgi:hypothetical protein
MNFNWITDKSSDKTIQRQCIELEYRLRPKITRFLLTRLEKECRGDFSCFYFDVDLASRTVSISPKTPVKYSRRIAEDFDREIKALGS